MTLYSIPVIPHYLTRFLLIGSSRQLRTRPERHIVAHQACPAGSPLHLAVSPDEVNPLYPLECIGRFRGAVEQIAITGSVNYHAVLSHLAQRQESSAEEGGPWLYPGSKMINLLACSGINSIAAIREDVKDRWVKIEDSGAKSNPEGYLEVIMPARN